MIPCDEQTAIEECDNLILSGKGGMIFTPNPTILYNAKEDPELQKILSSADVCLCDGVGVALGARILGYGKIPRVCGVDYGEKIAELCARRGYSLYLLGGERGVAERAAKNLIAKYSSLKIAGTHHGYYEREWRLLSEISLAEPQVIFVCLGSPKQEKFIYYNQKNLASSVMLGLGGSLDIYAGEKKRCPRILRSLCMEWAYRLVREPKRIKKAHLLAFAKSVALERFSVKFHKKSDKITRKKVKS